MRQRVRAVLAVLAVLAGLALDTGTAHADPPGTVEDVEELPAHLWLDGTSEAYRITYWSTGSHNEPVLVNGAVFLPQGRPPAGGWPVVDYEHSTTGLAQDCAPSRAGYASHEQAYVSAWLRNGYAVTATDYVIPGNPGVEPYLDGSTAARNAVDVVRAAREILPDTLASGWAAVGDDQGGHASLFTAALATRYAPELDYQGAVATAPVANPVSQASRYGPASSERDAYRVATLAYLLRGLKAARSNFDLDSYLTPTGRTVVGESERRCLTDLMRKVRADGISVGAMLSRPLDQGDFATTARPVIDIPHTGIDRPVLVAQGDRDTETPTHTATVLVDYLRRTGVRDLTYRRYLDADHVSVLTVSLNDALSYVRGLFG